MSSKKTNIDNSNSVALNFTELENAFYNSFYRIMRNDFSKARKYSKNDIRRFLENPIQYERQLREASQYLLNTSSHYYRMVNYLATMLTLDWVLVPVHIDKSKVTKDQFKKEYNKITKFLDSYNIKNEFVKINKILVAEDIFYGIERKLGNSIIIQRLPSNYCKITGFNEAGYTFHFNLRYFDGLNKNIENYPDEIKEAYKKYKNGSIDCWYEITENPVCFKFNMDLEYGVPLLSPIFEDILELEALRDLIKQKEKIENFKLLVQKIPMKKDAKNEKDFLISLDSVKMFHKNIKSALPDGVALVSTPMELDSVSFEKKRDTAVDNVSKAEEQLYNSAGFSSSLFNAEKSGSIGLNRSLEVDQNMMFTILRQYEKYFNYRLSKITSDKLKFKIMFPDITHFNKKEKIEIYLKGSQFGMPKGMLAAAYGYSTTDLISLVTLENDYLSLTDSLIPLSSSHTQTNDDNKGRPEKNEDELSDKGLDAKNREANDNRAK